jgi:hypothetical protein
LKTSDSWGGTVLNVLDQLRHERETVKSILAEMEESPEPTPSKATAFLRRFTGLPGSDAEYASAVVKAMRARLERHVEEEEFEVWKNLRRFLTSDQRRKMDARFAAGKVFGTGLAAVRAQPPHRDDVVRMESPHA